MLVTKLWRRAFRKKREARMPGLTYMATSAGNGIIDEPISHIVTFMQNVI